MGWEGEGGETGWEAVGGKDKRASRRLYGHLIAVDNGMRNQDNEIKAR